jgi:hypothetical protein
LVSEHFPPDIGSRQAQSRLRLRFLSVLDEIHHRVLDELRALWSDFKPTYEAEVQRESEPTSGKAQTENSGWTEPIARGFLDRYYDWIENGNPAVEQLTRRLDDWSDEFHIRCPWITEAALSTIDTWERVPEAEETRAWFWHPAGIWTPLEQAGQEFVFVDRWDPLQESPAEAKARIREAMGTGFDRWIREAEASAVESGYKAPPTLRQEEDHLRWLVRYQVLQHSAETIFQDAGDVGSTQAIRQAAKRMAKRIGLPFKKRPRGRPPKRPADSGPDSSSN